MSRLVRGVAFSASLTLAACSGAATHHAAAPTPTIESSTVPNTVPTLSDAQMLATDRQAERYTSGLLDDLSKKQLALRIGGGVCAIILKFSSHEAFVVPNPDVIQIQQPNRSSILIEYAGYFAQKHETIFSPAIETSSPEGIGHGQDRRLSNTGDIFLSDGPKSEPDDARSVMRTTSGMLRDSGTGLAVASVLATAEGLSDSQLATFANTPTAHKICQEAIAST